MCTDDISYLETIEVLPQNFSSEASISDLMSELSEFELSEQEKLQAIHIIKCLLESAVRVYLGLDAVTDAIDLRQFENAISERSVVNSKDIKNKKIENAACLEHATEEESHE